MVAERSDIDFEDWRVTPGVGLRIASFLGPIRLDLGYNPHPPRAGPLYELVGSELVPVNPSFRPRINTLDRFRLHLSIGQAF
jgi:outer membrane protein assembly factor BamA